MQLGTIDRTPPPFFRQGPSALTKLVFFSALAIFLMVADSRFQLAANLRATLAVLLLPVQRVLAVPVDLWNGAGDYVGGLQTALGNEKRAKASVAAQAERLQRVQQLAQENVKLRALLDLRPALGVRSQAAEILFEASDPYSRKVLIDRGLTQGVVLGSPVVNEVGVLGQVTRAYPLTAEVTLLSDKDAAIPVLNTRTQQRGAAYGGAAGGPNGMELRFTSANADVMAGDMLHTSGLDGVYPPGLLVARVVNVERRDETGFARVLLKPEANVDGVRHVLVLEPLSVQLPARPPVAVEAVKPERVPAGPGRRSASQAAPMPVPASGAAP
jgi:rod shape-determining protein MreC